jgi:hypothetical protein
MVDESLLQDCLQIVDRTVYEYGNGKMPPDRSELIAMLMNKFARPENVAADMRARLSLAQWEQARADFALNLATAFEIFTRDRVDVPKLKKGAPTKARLRIIPYFCGSP